MEGTERAIEYDAEFDLEAPVRCPVCREIIKTLNVVRLLRAKVNFTSTVPRRGFLTVCPSCCGVVPTSVGSRLA